MNTIETHLSRVHLFDADVYKTLKSVAFPFVDLTTIEQRQVACQDEVMHNMAWAPGVYLGVAEYQGEPAVHMRRLPADRTLETLELTPTLIHRVGEHIREVHTSLPKHEVSAFPYRVRQRILQNLQELQALDVPHILRERLKKAVSRGLARADFALQERAACGRLLHGDLRAEHVYVEDETVLILDGVAFNPSLAEGDPVEDVAFLVMDLTCKLGRWDLEDALWESATDPVAPELRDLYVAHRALIRAKVELLQGAPERALPYLLHALTRLEPATQRPALVAIGGLPGTGKSTLAAQLARFVQFEVIRTDVIRQTCTKADYSPEGRSRVYEQAFQGAASMLRAGGRVVIDGSFSTHAWREGVIDLARELGLRPIFLFCWVSQQTAEHRIKHRHGDASEADVEVYRGALERWEDLSIEERELSRWVETDGDASNVLHEALGSLSEWTVAYPMFCHDLQRA